MPMSLANTNSLSKCRWGALHCGISADLMAAKVAQLEGLNTQQETIAAIQARCEGVTGASGEQQQRLATSRCGNQPGSSVRP